DIVLAGGITVRIPQKIGYFYQPEMILSKDGHCRPFDMDASGTIFGSGAGIVVLKRLEDAVRDNDLIHAIVKGTTVNNDGSDKIDYTAPGRKGQEAVLAHAIAIAGIPKETITAIEAHGTGTILGDPIEFESLQKVYGHCNHSNGKIALGSVKSNIGHLECAAGVASFIKMVLSLKHKTLIPSLNFTKPNPHIDLENSNFYVNTKTKGWQVTEGMPRRCAVSSFGIGGTNTHVILEEAVPLQIEKQVEKPVELIILSAKTQEAIDRMSKNIVRFLKQNNSVNISDLASTLKIGRKAFNFRSAIVARNNISLIEAIENNDQKKIFTAYKRMNEPEVVFMFPGQGAQYIFMASEIYENEPVFKENVDLCAKIIKSHLKTDIRDLIFPKDERAEEASKQLSHTKNTQLAIFTIEYSLAKLWMSWGIHPDAMIGHSLGEYIAACLSGVFSLEDALTVVVRRSELINTLPYGSMCGIMLPVEKLRPYLNEKLSIAAINGPTLTVVSGHTDEIEKFTHLR
ncbi:type I polyketide synthase, partial [bacterium]|nr:type I polyketide synthase [bacterium]